ncbi:MAG: hypothetical protein GF311_15005 [Candidatus Lokiarchaeota archaeon]|nr:hypothetical protein [Candidatus Lokiarchaeota archaeon]
MSKVSSLFKKKFIPIYICFILTILLYGVIFLLARFPNILFGLGIPEEFVTHFVKIIPGPLWSDILLLYLIPLGVYIGMQYLSPYSTRFYMRLHKSFYVLRKKPIYGINPNKGHISTGKIFLRLLKGSFLSFVIATGIMQFGLTPVFRQITGDPGMAITLFRAEAIFLATFFFSFLIVIIYFPIWNLEDAGLIAYRKFTRKRKNPDIEGVNRIFRDFIEYSISFSTILVYFNLFFNTLTWVINYDPSGASLLIPLILIFLPFLIPGLYAIPMIFYEMNFDKNMKRIHKHLEEKDIPYINVPDFHDLIEEKQPSE